jgi:hypothetical protein
MTVVSFPPRIGCNLRSWRPHELETLVAVYEANSSRGDASAWDVGATEHDDPQFYILGPGPNRDCIVTISRVGRIYVLENGTGQVLHEGSSLATLAAQAKLPVAQRNPASLAARITLALTALRLALEEKIEPILVESEEFLLRLIPQLATLV